MDARAEAPRGRAPGPADHCVGGDPRRGTVTAIAGQSRWRPVWFVDVERDGERLELCVRGERLDIPGVWPLRHEMTVQALLEAGGIPVPKVYGWCDDPAAFVTDRVPGRADSST